MVVQCVDDLLGASRSLSNCETGTKVRLNFLHSLGYVIPPDKVTKDTTNVLNEIFAELLAVRTMALLNQFALDFLLAKEGGTRAIIGAECCIYMPDESTDIIDLSQHITQEIQTLNTIASGLSGVLG
ncbi:hypothetical protein chiPu_0019662 [Chiloscyllium punctatum]|uniref:Uncharacterized protein n=1 Tax=Chiloscyllium punctatum TaxID=137246 RepID=A0A401RSR9_CHIPU|nr:hypothetical protein [Chiloscyllium punctatum]